MPHTLFLTSRRAGLTWLLGSLVAAHSAVADQSTPRARSADSGSNRVEVTGNRAVQQDAPPCVITPSGARGPVNVNSVTLDGSRLEGRTVVVAGRNSSNVDATRCNESDGRPQTGSGANVNSINIR